MKNQNFHSDFIQQWSAERQKSRKRHLYSVPAAFLGFQFLWMIWQLRTSSAEELQHGYTMLFYQLPMLNAILLPVMAAVIASRLCDMELKGDTLKLLYTLQKRTVFYDCKYLAGLKYVLAFSLGQCVLILLGGRLCRISEAARSDTACTICSRCICRDCGTSVPAAVSVPAFTKSAPAS